MKFNLDIEKLPNFIPSGEWHTGHVQGAAIDPNGEFIYLSFTTVLVKYDMKGNVIGSVGGLRGHLGDLIMNPEDGRVYGSLEYKEELSFYIAIFDVSKITALDMDAEKDGIMTCVYLKDVVDDYSADMDKNGVFDGNTGKTLDHRYGCSGIDGVTFGPAFGKDKNSPKQFFVAYGIYRHVDRIDNDYQVILQYDWREFAKYEKPLSQTSHHISGPEKSDEKYFIFTGNTTYGVQNLVYDEYLNVYFMAVYVGTKADYPNFSLYAIDQSFVPYKGVIKGQETEEMGTILELKKQGLYHADSDVYGWFFPHGTTGFISLGEGYFYMTTHVYTPTPIKTWTGDINKYKWTGKARPFDKV